MRSLRIWGELRRLTLTDRAIEVPLRDFDVACGIDRRSERFPATDRRSRLRSVSVLPASNARHDASRATAPPSSARAVQQPQCPRQTTPEGCAIRIKAAAEYGHPVRRQSRGCSTSLRCAYANQRSCNRLSSSSVIASPPADPITESIPQCGQSGVCPGLSSPSGRSMSRSVHSTMRRGGKVRRQ
jgi:hypothetical protein